MIDLREHARNKRSKEETGILTARLPVSKIEKFKELCKELDISVNEAIHLFVDEQIALIEGSATKNNTFSITKKDESMTYSNTDENEGITYGNTEIDALKKEMPAKPKRRTSSGKKRVTTVKWQIENEAPCPICVKWVKATNYARHAKTQHNGLTTEEIFTNAEHIQTADEMVQKRKERL